MRVCPPGSYLYLYQSERWCSAERSGNRKGNRCANSLHGQDPADANARGCNRIDKGAERWLLRRPASQGYPCRYREGYVRQRQGASHLCARSEGVLRRVSVPDPCAGQGISRPCPDRHEEHHRTKPGQRSREGTHVPEKRKTPEIQSLDIPILSIRVTTLII